MRHHHRSLRSGSLSLGLWLGLLSLALLVGSRVDASERLLFVKGRAIRAAALDSMMVLPGEGIVDAAHLYRGFANVPFVETDVLVHSLTNDTFSSYQDSEYFQSGILENATPFELFVHVPPSPVPVGLYEYLSLHGTSTLNDVLDQPGGVVFYDLQLPRSTPPPDETPPVLHLPADFLVDATSAAGAIVNYLVSATDAVDPSPVIVCAPPSGSLFSVGTTTVDCTATDRSQNSSEGSFLVTVHLLPLSAIADLQARARITDVTLVWTPVPEAVAYNLYRRFGNEPFAQIALGHVTDYATYLDSGLTPGIAYTYVVRWVHTDGRESPDSNEATATPTARRAR